MTSSKKINEWRQHLQGLISMLQLQFYSSDLLNLPKELNIWRAAVGQVLILKCEVWKSKESVPRNAEKLETSAICLQRRESINDVLLYRVPKIKFNASSTGFLQSFFDAFPYCPGCRWVPAASTAALLLLPPSQHSHSRWINLPAGTINQLLLCVLVRNGLLMDKL